MKIQTAPQLISYSQPAPAQAAPPEPAPREPGDTVEVKSSGLGRGAAATGGALAGAAAAAVSTAAFVFASKALLHLVVKSLPGANPAISHVLDQALSLTSAASPALILGAGALGAAQGAITGAAVAYQAADGATKEEYAAPASPTRIRSFKDAIDNLLEANRDSGAEMREHLGNLKGAKSVGSAAVQGGEAATCLLGPAGGAAGKVQGALFGFLLGGAAGLPLMSVVPHPGILIPTAIAGALLGSKIGPYVGFAANSATAAVVGGVGGAAYHAVSGHHG